MYYYFNLGILIALIGLNFFPCYTQLDVICLLKLIKNNINGLKFTQVHANKIFQTTFRGVSF